MLRPTARLSMLMSLLAALAGCAGYSAAPLYRQDVNTVAVDILANRSFYRGVEFDVSEALVKEIEAHTPYKVVAHGAADTLMTGTIRSVDQGVLSRTRDGGVPQEVQVTVVAGFEWKDQRSGQVIRKRGSVTGTGEYIPTMPVGEPFEIARHRAAAELARQVVSIMRSDW